MEFNTEVLLLLKEQNKISKELLKEMHNLSLLFEKYDSEYQDEVENQGPVISE